MFRFPERSLFNNVLRRRRRRRRRRDPVGARLLFTQSCAYPCDFIFQKASIFVAKRTVILLSTRFVDDPVRGSGLTVFRDSPGTDFQNMVCNNAL